MSVCPHCRKSLSAPFNVCGCGWKLWTLGNQSGTVEFVNANWTVGTEVRISRIEGVSFGKVTAPAKLNPMGWGVIEIDGKDELLFSVFLA